MQKIISFSIVSLAMLGFMSCKPDTPVVIENNEAYFEKVVPNFVNNTVIPTYKSLADNAFVLHDALITLRTNKTDDNVRAAVNQWAATRKIWEQSEAFLFGAAANFHIDPRIDHWPLDKNALAGILGNVDNLQGMTYEELLAWANAQDVGVLGFHGLEYILFAAGNPKLKDQISDNQLIYAIAIAGDLRNQCIRLEAAWAGYDNVSDEKQAIIDEEELTITFANNRNYGENMKNAGKAGSTYKNFTDAAEDIIQGCVDIADEVATMKIGKPNSGDDITYIESPYSYNSTKDYADNMESIRFTYLGGVTVRNESLHTFFETKNKNLDNRILTAINSAVAAINAIQNFEIDPTSAVASNAVESVINLRDVLIEAQAELRK